MRILGREETDQRTMGGFYVVFVQATLLFRLETWVAIPHMMRTLGGFRHRVVRRITRNMPNKCPDGGWEFPPIAEELREAGIQEL